MISPVGTADRGLARPSLRDLGLLDPSPSVETQGYSHPSLRDEDGEILVALALQPADAPAAPDSLPSATRRYSRLKICATSLALRLFLARGADGSPTHVNYPG